ncbi:MAG: substrate-binding domain-containing protein [Clostridiales Family XIII bacterium]|jgi:ribose transport system substrate-binding protein|nr:substrate-binding domain-containing protein [Clostridiales Family XIII bacterium]
MKKSKLIAVLLCLALVFGFTLSACGGGGSDAGSEAASGSATDTSNVDEIVDTVTGGDAKVAAEGAKFMWYQAGAHPFFDEMYKGVVAFGEEYGVTVERGVGTDWTQGEEDQLVRAYAADGYNAMAIFPADPGGANSLYDELVGQGVAVVNFGATTTEPTTASFYCGTDIPNCVDQAANALVDVMEANGVENGNVILAVGSLGDLNAQKCKEAAEKVFAERGVTVLQVVSDMSQPDDAQQKMEQAIAANLANLDGILSTDTNPTDGSVPVLRELYEKNPDQKHIYFIGRDTDEICLEAIKDGTFDGTSSQNAFHMGYSPLVLLNYLKAGWTPKEGSYYQYGAHMIVDKDNVDTFNQELIDLTMDWIATIETDVLDPPAA